MRPLSVLVSLVVAAAAVAAEPDKDEFVPMFNGKDLTGWVNVNTHPGTFFVKDGMIITTGKPTGYLRTDKQYENFVAEFDWMHIPPKPGAVGNSDKGKSPSAPLVTTMRLLAGFHVGSTGFRSFS